MGVIYSVGDDVGEILCPFIADKGGTCDIEQVNSVYRAASLGQISAKEFWEAVSVNPAFEDEYLARHCLTQGLMSLLEIFNVHGYQLWCLSNDVSEWSLKLRNRFELDRFFHGFVISGDVGVRKPDRAIFDCLLRKTAAKPDEIVLVDDRLSNLDAAARLGLQTVFFGSQRACRTHSVAKDCGDLVTLLLDPRKRDGG